MTVPAPVTLTMIGHAGVLIETPGLGLLIDPWLGGRIFDESWELLLPSLPVEAFADRVTHIWISHEHPDHLHWPSLRAIAALRGPMIDLLFQEHWSSEVPGHLGRLGFRSVTELRPGEWTRVGPADLLSLPFGRIDCAQAIRVGETVLLNLNDTKLGARSLRRVRAITGRPRLLMTQFSIASWQPRTSATPSRKVVDRAIAYQRALQAHQVLLFASHARFCHADNRRLNDVALPADAAAALFAEATGDAPLCLLPGQSWPSAVDAERAAAAYRVAANRPDAAAPPDVPCDLGALLGAAVERTAAVRQAFPWWRRCRVPTLVVSLRDVDRDLVLDLRRGTAAMLPSGSETPHLETTSAMMRFACTQRWGFDTLDVAGRYEVVSGTKDHPALDLLGDHGAGFHYGWPLRTYLSRRFRRYFWARRVDLIERRIKRARARRAFVKAMRAGVRRLP